jgi:hypothetical protein
LHEYFNLDFDYEKILTPAACAGTRTGIAEHR